MTQKSGGNGDKLWRYSWDYENRLTTAWNGKMRVRYWYDALGRRVARNAGLQGGTKFTYDGADVILDQDADGNTVKYLNGAGIDNKLRQTVNAGQASYFLADQIGSTNALVNASGAIISQTNYDAFGNQTATLATRYGYTGRERDDATGLMYYRARQYSPDLGRFISEDPIGFRGGDINQYSYVRNNPFRFRDSKGLFPWNTLYETYYMANPQMRIFPTKYNITGDVNAPDEVYEAGLRGGAKWMKCYLPLRGMFVFGGVSANPAGNETAEGLVIGGWNIDDNDVYAGPIVAGGYEKNHFGYHRGQEYTYHAFEGQWHNDGINLFDTPIGGSYLDDGGKLGFYRSSGDKAFYGYGADINLSKVPLYLKWWHDEFSGKPHNDCDCQ